MSSQPVLNDESFMERALELARSAIGSVEPNPAVGSVITTADGKFIAEGFHAEFGGPHAEVVALRAAGTQARGATIYVTLEPCSHLGKTPPCADALIAAGVSRVVIGTVDPAPHVAGTGITKLREAGIQVDVGVCEAEAQNLIAPFRKLFTQNLPFVHAKWAMTLDGKIATHTGSSKWISNKKSRAIVHQLRGRMDAILSGIGTVLADDPLLTARPAGRRVPLRVILDSQARLPLDSNLVKTAHESPVLLFVSDQANPARVADLKKYGVEVIQIQRTLETGLLDIISLLEELGRRQLTNVLIEAGSGVLGAFLDAQQVDEVHCFIAPKLIGGANALSPFGGFGLESMENAVQLRQHNIEVLDGDLYIHGRVH